MFSEDKFTKRSKILKVATGILLATLLFGSGYTLGLVSKVQTTPQPFQLIVDRIVPQGKNIRFDLFWNVWDIVKEKSILQPVVDEKLFYGSIRGLVESLGDPYSSFLDPDSTKKFSEDIQGKFFGIGAEIGRKDNFLVIVAPLPNSPSEEAGLRAEDKILFINNVDTTDLNLDEAVNLIRGEKGTEVLLKIFRNNEEEPRDISIVRDEISVPSVIWEMKDRVGYIRIIHFQEDTTTKFNEAAQDLILKNPKGLVIDLRNNPGGYLDRAIDVLSKFIENKPAVIEQFADGRRETYNTSGTPILQGIPTVVLVNAGSASASEIVAGALQDYGIATLVGETTFGKGSVQDWQGFDDGSSLKITVASWLTPNGRSLDKQGVVPDIEIEITEEDYEALRDPQLEKALEIINKE